MAPIDPGVKSRITALLASQEDWLIARVLGYAKRHGYARYIATLAEAWRAGVRGLSGGLCAALERCDDGCKELALDVDPSPEAGEAFPLIQGLRHFDRGVTLPQFIALLKYFCQGYLDLIEATEESGEARALLLRFVRAYFDHLELGVCGAWEGLAADAAVARLQDANRRLTLEKVHYHTLFESLALPVIFLGPGGEIQNMNFAAARAFLGVRRPGVWYYGDRDCGSGLDWLSQEVRTFVSGGAQERILEHACPVEGADVDYEIGLHRAYDLTGQCLGVTATFHDVTRRKRSEAALIKAKEEAERLNGELRASAVRARLPRVSWGAAAETRAYSPVPEPRTRILLVEDDSLDARLTRLHLEAEGWEVRTVANGDEAVRGLGSGPFDLILVDVHSPDPGVLEAMRRVRRQEAVREERAQVIALTSWIRPEDWETLEAVGADDYIVRPLPGRELVERLRRRLSLRKAAPAANEKGAANATPPS